MSEIERRLNALLDTDTRERVEARAQHYNALGDAAAAARAAWTNADGALHDFMRATWRNHPHSSSKAAVLLEMLELLQPHLTALREAAEQANKGQQ